MIYSDYVKSKKKDGFASQLWGEIPYTLGKAADQLPRKAKQYGELPHLDPLKKAMKKNLSDNTATNHMIDVVGMTEVNKLLEKMGFKKTRLVRKMQADVDPDKVENLTTPREFSRLMGMILGHDGLDEKVCEKTLNVLKLYKDGVIFEALPEDYVVADKSGWMGGVQCDSGIVYAEKPYIVTVMASHIPAWDRNGYMTRETLKQIVSEIHDYYQNKTTTSRYGRRTS